MYIEGIFPKKIMTEYLKKKNIWIFEIFSIFEFQLFVNKSIKRHAQRLFNESIWHTNTSMTI